MWRKSTIREFTARTLIHPATGSILYLPMFRVHTEAWHGVRSIRLESVVARKHGRSPGRNLGPTVGLQKTSPESQSKPGVKMVCPEPCKKIRKAAEAISGCDCCHYPSSTRVLSVAHLAAYTTGRLSVSTDTNAKLAYASVNSQ